MQVFSVHKCFGHHSLLLKNKTKIRKKQQPEHIPRRPEKPWRKREREEGNRLSALSKVGAERGGQLGGAGEAGQSMRLPEWEGGRGEEKKHNTNEETLTPSPLPPSCSAGRASPR